MTSEEEGGRVTHPAPQKAATTRTRAHLTAADRLAVQLPLVEDSVYPGKASELPVESPGARADPGFFAKALSGKVRPAPREPQTTHYSCRDACCRSWSA